jgi:hypothetical protein
MFSLQISYDAMDLSNREVDLNIQDIIARLEKDLDYRISNCYTQSRYCTNNQYLQLVRHLLHIEVGAMF